MAKVEKRKARKDYPEHGIKAGEDYYYVQIKTGPRSSKVMRSLKPFKPSQLTVSSFKSAWLSVDEAFSDSPEEGEDIRAAADAIRDAGQEARNAFDNMPEGLQQGDTGQMLEARADKADEVADALEELASEWDDLEEPQEPTEAEPDQADEEAHDAWEMAQDEYETARQEFEDEQERIKGEAADLLSDMPD
jgi:hypothetical protein